MELRREHAYRARQIMADLCQEFHLALRHYIAFGCDPLTHHAFGKKIRKPLW
ncbi:hypothetical protein AB0B25_03280 [Nocardia sp. NPDC049190]|uniref:hypothetical protein n=1 Tax=Nocardia sp. NPDC049190 TaxID=3155650 RepID=UPI0033E2DF1F